MKRNINLLYFIIIFCGSGYSQTATVNNLKDFSFRIDSICITGNDITEEEIIYRELTFKVNETVDSAILKYNEDRIYSLGIFNTVNLVPRISNEKTILNIIVKESWYIWPLPFADLKDRSWDKITYGFDINVKNFRGRNENLRTRFAFGYDPSINLQYYNPLFISKSNISLQAVINYGTMKNISGRAKYFYQGDFDQKYSNALITLGKRFNLFNYLFLLGGFQYVETPRYVKGISSSDERIDRIYIAGLSYIYDSRDLAQFPDKGILFNTSYQLKGIGINGINYKVFNLDFREYRPLIGDLSSKWRFYTRQTFGENIPYFDYSYLGYAERVRGHFKSSVEGNSAYLASLEVKYPVIKEWEIEFNFPIIPKSLQTYRVSIYTQTFFDAGTVRDREAELMMRNIISGYGFGFTLLVLPYNTARLEMGFDEHGNNEWIFELGISF